MCNATSPLRVQILKNSHHCVRAGAYAYLCPSGKRDMAQSSDHHQTTDDTPPDDTWEYQPDQSTDHHHIYTDDIDRHLEIAYQNGDEWSAELFHTYGCTRLSTADTLDELYTTLNHRNYDLSRPDR